MDMQLDMIFAEYQIKIMHNLSYYSNSKIYLYEVFENKDKNDINKAQGNIKEMEHENK